MEEAGSSNLPKPILRFLAPMIETTIPGLQNYRIIGMAKFDAAAGFYVAVAVITLLIVFATTWVLLSTRSS